MTLHIRRRVEITNPRTLICSPNTRRLLLRARCRDTHRRTVAITRRGADDCADGVAVGHRLVEPLEDYCVDGLGFDVAVGFGVEDLAEAGSRVDAADLSFCLFVSRVGRGVVSMRNGRGGTNLLVIRRGYN
jgi:hypothetical protein